MAKITEESLLIHISRLAPIGADVEPAVTEELIQTLRSVASELVPGAVIEVEVMTDA